MKKLLFFLVLVLASKSVWGQTVTGDRLRLTAGPCVLTSATGTPNVVVFSGTCSGITTSAATNLTLKPTGDLMLDPAGADVLPVTNYTVNMGALNDKFLTLHAAELWVETLVAQNTIATIGGRVLVAPTNILTQDLAAGGTSLAVKYNNLSSAGAGDVIYLEANGKVEFMRVTTGPTPSGGMFFYGITRNLDGSGANQWYAGDAVLDTGQTNNGFIDLYSTVGVLSGSGPTIVGNVRTANTNYNDIAARWAIGNLNGLYGYSSQIYGAAFGNPSATFVTVDPTNGFRIINNSGGLQFLADTSGNMFVSGRLAVSTNGAFFSGATGYNTGTGIWLEYNAGTPLFRIGNPAGNQLTWDGSVLTIVGVGSGITSIDGGNIQTGTITANKLNVSTLSAITANIGTVTAGSISGVTFTAGAVTLDGSGLTLTSGVGTSNHVKWTDSSFIGSNLGSMSFSSSVDFSFNKRVGAASLGAGDMSGFGAGFVCVDNGGTLYFKATACP